MTVCGESLHFIIKHYFLHIITVSVICNPYWTVSHLIIHVLYQHAPLVKTMVWLGVEINSYGMAETLSFHGPCFFVFNACVSHQRLSLSNTTIRTAQPHWDWPIKHFNIPCITLTVWTNYKINMSIFDYGYNMEKPTLLAEAELFQRL